AYRGIGGAARHAVTESNVAFAVHRYTAHPAVIPVGGVGALLVDRGRAVRVSYLVPADPGLIATHIYRMVDHHRFVVSEVAVREPIHQAVGERVKPLGCGGLGNAVGGSIWSGGGAAGWCG